MTLTVRVGLCLALSASVMACTAPQQAATAPSATTGGTAAAAADGSTLKFNSPAQVAPIDGERAEDRRPTLIWANATGKYGSIGVAYDIEVSSPAEVVYSMTVGETPDFGSHLLPFDLEYETTYSWRIRARVGNEFGPWSPWADFLSPQRPVVTVAPPTGGDATTVCAAPLSPLGPGETRKPRPNESAIVRRVAEQYPAAIRNSCQEHGGSWEFMDRSVDALRAKDGRWGYNAKRGNMNDPSLDVVSYYHGGGNDIQGSTSVYIFDIIGGHCGSTPFVVWNDVTDATYNNGTVGRTMFPRPGRNVVPGNCTASAAGQ